MSFLTRLPRLPFFVTRSSSSWAASKNPTPSTSTAEKVDILSAKRKLVSILEAEGPISRRDLYDKHISQHFPVEPFTPNLPPRPIWLRGSAGPPLVYMTMSKFKREVVASLARERAIGIVTVFKIRKALELMNLEGPLRQKIELAIAAEADNAHVCVAGKWWRDFQDRVARDSAEMAYLRTGKRSAPRSLGPKRRAPSRGR